MNLRLSLSGSRKLLSGQAWLAAKDQLSYRPPAAVGTLLRAQDSKGDHLGWVLSEGPGGEPAFRVLSRERHPDFKAAWWAEKVERALARRRALAARFEGGPCRGVHGEADEVPGVSVDLWGPGLATLECASAGMAGFLPDIEAALLAQAKLKALWRRTAVEGKGGGLSPWHRSPLTPKAPARFKVLEQGQALEVDFDEGAAPPVMEQRGWRAWLRAQAMGKNVLLLGQGDRLAAAASAGGAAKVEAPGGDWFKALERSQGKGYGVLAAALPLEAKFAWGRFQAAKHLGRLLEGLRGAAAPEAALLVALTSPSGGGLPAVEGLEMAPLPGLPDLPLAPGLPGAPPAWVGRVAGAGRV